MTSGGEAAEQIVRMSLEAGEVALRISGQGAKHLAVLLYAVLKEQKKTKGRVRMESLVLSGKPLTVYSVKAQDMRRFVQEAKHYGIQYCAVRNTHGHSDGMVDVLIKEEDAVRVNRIVERFQFGAVKENAAIKTEIEKARTEQLKAFGAKKEGRQDNGQKNVGRSEAEKGVQERKQAEQFLDELFAKPVQKEETASVNPYVAKTEKSHPSAPSSEKPGRTAEGTSKQPEDKPSVRKELREIQAARKQEAELERIGEPAKDKNQKSSNKTVEHHQPAPWKKVKPTREVRK